MITGTGSRHPIYSASPRPVHPKIHLLRLEISGPQTGYERVDNGARKIRHSSAHRTSRFPYPVRMADPKARRRVPISVQEVFFSDDELAKLPSDPLNAAEIICDRWELFSAYLAKGAFKGDGDALYIVYIRWFALAQVFIDTSRNVFGVPMPELTTIKETNAKLITLFFQRLDDKVKSFAMKRITQTAVEHVAAAMGQRLFVFTFTDSDYDRMQELINELRDLISKSEKIVDNHKKRLLKRLEQLQGEVHKTVGDVDRALGVILEVSAVARQFGEDMKPLSDRAREMAEIIMRVMASFQGFPPLTLPDLTQQKPQLPSADNSDGI